MEELPKPARNEEPTAPLLIAANILWKLTYTRQFVIVQKWKNRQLVLMMLQTVRLHTIFLQSTRENNEWVQDPPKGKILLFIDDSYKITQ